MKVPVSILIPIKNEATNLPRCLESVAWADEIFVVDSKSNDGSQRIAEEHGATVVQFNFSGTWPKKKNWALENLPFQHEWVFILDADEVLPPGTEAEFARVIADKNCALSGYWINRRFMFMGRWLRHAYYPNWNLRLFKHRLGRYEKLTDADTASGDNEVHEHVVVQGAPAICKARWITTRFRPSMCLSRNTIVTRTGRPGWRSTVSCAAANTRCRVARSGCDGRSSDFRNACHSVRCCAFSTFISGNADF